MHIDRLNRILPGVLMFLALVSSCKNNDADDWLFVGADVGDNFVLMDFDASLSAMNGLSDGHESSGIDSFQLYGFCVSTKYSVFGKTSSTSAQNVIVTRSSDGNSWEYENPLNWWTYIKYPVSFYAIGGEGSSLASIGTNAKLPTLKVQLPVGNDGTVLSNETHDLLFASMLRINPYQYVLDSTKVKLDFEHILPQINLRASLANANDLEVTVRSATLMGLATVSEFDFNGGNPSWINSKSAGDVVMSLEKPVTLGTEMVDLQNFGAYIPPQTVKAWTSAARRDGAGIMLVARVRSKAANAYLVGDATSFGQVYVPIDDMSFASNTAYTIDITFDIIYDPNGAIGYRASWKPVVTPWKDKDDNLNYEYE